MTIALAEPVRAAEQSLRLKLLASNAVSTLYSVDDHLTLISAEKADEAQELLGGLCSETGGSFEKEGDAIKCAQAFDGFMIKSASKSGVNLYFVIKSSAAQPFTYKAATVPPPDEVSTPPNGLISGRYTSLDLFQYMAALCKKENGAPSVVVSKRYGRFARYTEVSSLDALKHFLSAGEGKDPWFFACNGTRRFMVEKSYRNPSEEYDKFFFYSNRGLEGIDFIKTDEAGKTPSIRPVPEYIESLAREFSQL